jgi:hypothetical protein
MAKRKSKRFGSSHEVHESMANDQFNRVMEETERANDMIDRGRCERALSAIGAAREASGMLRAHLRGTRAAEASPLSMNKVFEVAEGAEREIDSTERFFTTRCVKEAVVSRRDGRVELGKK